MPVLKRYKPIITLNKDEKVTKRLELFSLLNLNKVQVTFVGRINGEVELIFDGSFKQLCSLSVVSLAEGLNGVNR